MKKVALILLISLYSLSVLGVGVSQFYCCGKLKSTSISFVKDAKEKCSNTKNMKGCCQSTFKNFKVKDSHIGAYAINSSPAKYFADLHLLQPDGINTFARTGTNHVAHTCHAPPSPSHGVPIYIMNCIYRI